MTLIEREIVTPDRTIGMQLGERTIRDVARQYGVTYEAIIGTGGPYRIIGPARIAVARRLYAAGYRVTRIARVMNRNWSSISWYLGHDHKRRQPANTPERQSMGKRHARILRGVTDNWSTPRQIWERAGLEWKKGKCGSGSRASFILHGLLKRGSVQKGGRFHKPLWRLVP